MQAETVARVQEMTVWLAARCDGAATIDGMGFNGRDTRYGKKMAATPGPDWTDRDVRIMWRILETYKKQLAGGGFDWGQVPAPTPAVRTIGMRPAKRVGALQEFVVAFEKDDPDFYPMLQALKAIEGRYFEWEPEPVNVIPFSTATVEPIRELVGYWSLDEVGDVGAALSAAEQYLRDERRGVTEERRPDRFIGLVDDEHFGIEFIGRQFRDMLEGVKQIPGRKFTDDKEHKRKYWMVAITAENARTVTSYGKYFDFTFSEGAQTRINAIIAEAIENFEGSSAADADEVVEGLPAGLELMPFQRAGVAWTRRNQRTIIGDQMGLGKTIEALATLKKLDAFPAMVICPASLKYNWLAEINKWLPDRSALVLDGREPMPLLVMGVDIVILNYDILAAWMPTLREHFGAQAVVFDESHYLKNHKAGRSQAAADLVLGHEKEQYEIKSGRYAGQKRTRRVPGQPQPPVVLLLTGTPVLNRPSELIHPLQVIGGLERMGGFWEFSTKYCGAQHSSFGLDMSGAQNTETLNRELRRNGLLLRRRKEDVLKELPAKRWARLPVRISNRDEYDRVELDSARWFGERAAENAEFLASIQDLDEKQQKAAKKERREDAEYRARAAEHLTKITALKRVAAQGKMRAAETWIADFLEAGEKLVVFAWHRETVDTLAKKFQALTIQGSQKSADRAETVRRFQEDEDVRLLVCNIKAGGVGITLTAASDVLFIEYPWTPADMEQALDRVHRIGQHDSVTGWQLVGMDTIDDDIIELIEEKRQVVDAVTDGKVAEQQVSILKELIARLEARQEARQKVA